MCVCVLLALLVLTLMLSVRLLVLSLSVLAVCVSFLLVLSIVSLACFVAVVPGQDNSCRYVVSWFVFFVFVGSSVAGLTGDGIRGSFSKQFQPTLGQLLAFGVFADEKIRWSGEAPRIYSSGIFVCFLLETLTLIYVSGWPVINPVVNYFLDPPEVTLVSQS